VSSTSGAHRVEGARAGVEIVRRGRYLFVLNRTDAPAEVPVVGTNLLTGATHDRNITVGPGSAAVIREETVPS
jgi:beta-galactosidase